MIRIFSCDDPARAQELLGRQEEERRTVDEAVAAILDDVGRRGDEAVLDCTERFDGVRPDSLEVPRALLEQALRQADPEFLRVLKRARDNIAAYHQNQKRAGFVLDPRPGVVLGQRVMPLDRVGVYVPGGTARYPSTALMDIIPAKIAGVGEIVMVTPPDPDGTLPADILAAAAVAGADRVFRIGGAQAIAALSYGTRSVPRVDKIVGPGNIYVSTAKRMVYGRVDIDMFAGPSEVLIIADEDADPVLVAADLLSQAEHDRLAAAILVTTGRALADAVRGELETQLAALPRADIARHSIDRNSAVFVTDSLRTAAAISNKLAPEHLELCVGEPFALLPLVRHAGSVFLGRHTPEALGDYLAGPNHTLPTSGTARFSSPLSVDDFVKKSSFLYYDRAALREVAGDVAFFARREGLEAHARSVDKRFEKERETP